MRVTKDGKYLCLHNGKKRELTFQRSNMIHEGFYVYFIIELCSTGIQLNPYIDGFDYNDLTETYYTVSDDGETYYDTIYVISEDLTLDIDFPDQAEITDFRNDYQRSFMDAVMRQDVDISDLTWAMTLITRIEFFYKEWLNQNKNTKEALRVNMNNTFQHFFTV